MANVLFSVIQATRRGMWISVILVGSCSTRTESGDGGEKSRPSTTFMHNSCCQICRDFTSPTCGTRCGPHSIFATFSEEEARPAPPRCSEVPCSRDRCACSSSCSPAHSNAPVHRRLLPHPATRPFIVVFSRTQQRIRSSSSSPARIPARVHLRPPPEMSESIGDN
jgi:hypothetical protein